VPYSVAPIFLIRLAGVPFDVVQQLATPETSAAARQLLIKRLEFEKAKSNVEQLLGSRRHNLSQEQFRAWRKTIRARAMPPPNDPPFGVFADCHASAAELAKAEAQMHDCLHHQLDISRQRLMESARRVLPRYLVFAAGGVRELMEKRGAQGGDSSPRTKKLRARERHLLLYLQRVAAKNDTLSEFGPGSWGKVDNVRGIKLNPEPGVAKREVFLERWTAHVAAAAINADPEAKAHMEVPALEPYAFEVLSDDVAKWPSTPARDKWLSILQPIAELPKKFAANDSIASRIEIMDEANRRLAELGGSRESTRFLYAATNPIGEECLRESNFEVGQNLIDEVATEAAPWIDLWRDNYAFVAHRIAAGLRGILEKMNSDAVELPSFLSACEDANLPLTGAGMVGLAHMAFREVKALFRKRMEAHADKEEHQLTVDDCRFVRQNFEYVKFDEYTYPSADLQLAAASTDAVAHGDYQWILAELHPPVALLHHGFYWGCPDKPSLSQQLASTLFGKPNFHYGFFAADFTATTTVRFFDALPSLTWFVAPQRGNSAWQTVRPAEAEVYVDPNGDVCLRRIGDRQHLGSFARNWIIPLGFHPFSFSCGKHTPRLRCGKVVMQRQMWTVALDEIGKGDFTGISRDLVLAVERLRAARSLPRFVYIRPTEQALRRSGAEGRDKDTKPVFVDLESYLFLEIFHRWLTKAGELEVTEMLPTPEQLLWQEADGRRTFELRTLIVPRR
jgi:hypothetical protein